MQIKHTSTLIAALVKSVRVLTNLKNNSPVFKHVSEVGPAASWSTRKWCVTVAVERKVLVLRLPEGLWGRDEGPDPQHTAEGDVVIPGNRQKIPGNRISSSGERSVEGIGRQSLMIHSPLSFLLHSLFSHFSTLCSHGDSPLFLLFPPSPRPFSLSPPPPPDKTE